MAASSSHPFRIIRLLTALALTLVLSRLATAGVLGNPHIRTSDHHAEALLATGLAQSSVFRHLVDRLNASHIVVYVELAWLTPRLTGELTLIGAGDGWRYVRVQIACHQTEVHQLVALAHELRHALEVAEAPEVVDAASLRRLYRSIGVDNCAGSDCRFETDAAQETASAVRRELVERGARPGPATNSQAKSNF